MTDPTKPELKLVTDAPKPAADVSSFLEDPPSVCIYGSPGTGKSTEIFKAFPNSLFLVTAKQVLRPAASFIRDNPSCGLHMPLPAIDPDSGKPSKITFDKKANGGKGATFYEGWENDAEGVNKLVTREYEGLRRGAYIVLPEFAGHDDKNNPLRVNNWQLLTQYGNGFVNRIKKEPDRYESLVLDEMSQFSVRVHEDIKADRRFCATSGNVNTFKANNELHVFHRWIGRFISATAKKAVIIACHATEPKYHDDDNDPRKGQLKYMGGPKFPLGALIESVTADMDIVMHLKMETDIDGARRVYDTEADPRWVRKFRDFAIKAKEPIGLRSLLVRAGYNL